MKGRHISLEKRLIHCQNCIPFSSEFLQRDLWQFFKVTVNYEVKKKNRTFWILMETGSELILIPIDLNDHCGPSNGTGYYGGHVVNKVWLKTFSQ